VRRFRLLVQVLGLISPLLSHAAEPQQVNLASLDGTSITAWVFQPEGKPRATVVALHGCGGLYATEGSRKGRFSARHQSMVDRLVVQGYAVVFPDSLTPRGVTQLCTQKPGERRVGLGERRRDALATLNWVATQSWGNASRIALLGWSHGGSAVLEATDGAQQEVVEQPIKAAVAIAFYPGCTRSLKSAYQANTRLLILLGALDDWTPPAPCIELGRSVGAQVQVYPESYHGFDNPVGAVTLWHEIRTGVNPGQGVHVGPNPVAREQANARVLEALAAAFD
jgi:dienelactone hydrolase